MSITSINESNIHRPPLNAIIIFRRDLDLEIYYKTSDDKIHKIHHDDDIYKIQKVEGFLGFKNWNNQLYPSGEKIEVGRITSQEFFFKICEDKCISKSVGGRGRDGFQGAQGFQGKDGSAGGAQGFQGNQGDTGSQGAQGNQGSQGLTGSGNQGVQGDIGSQGNQGNQGDSGPQGFQGDTGSQGVQGNQANNGTQGFQGDIGVQGATGSQGSIGAQGFQGNIGTTGTQGVQGNDGAQGTQGNQGISGTNGTQGFQGNVGAQGVQGNTGTIGSQGNQGVTGSTGSQGFQGSIGVTGAQGFQGLTGSAGAQGFQGSTGAQGTQGNQGVQGNQGNGVPAAGATGTILRSNGANWVASTNTYPDTTAANNILYATGLNAIGSSTGLTFNGSTFAVSFSDGTGSVVGITNTNTNNSTTFAYAGLNLSTQAGTVTGGLILSPTSGSVLSGGGAVLRTTTAHSLVFQTNSTERARFLSTGELLVGATSTGASEFVVVRKDQNAGTWQSLINATNGTAGRAVFSVSNSSTLATNISMQSISAAFITSGMLVADTGILIATNAGGMNVGTFSNTQLSFWTNNTKKVEISAVGNMSIGGVATRGTTVGTNALQIFNGTAPVGTLTNGVSIYSAAGYLKSIDAAGTLGHILSASAVNVVSPTAQNRTITVDIGGTTYYITAKTTND